MPVVVSPEFVIAVYGSRVILVCDNVNPDGLYNGFQWIDPDGMLYALSRITEIQSVTEEHHGRFTCRIQSAIHPDEIVSATKTIFVLSK